MFYSPHKLERKRKLTPPLKNRDEDGNLITVEAEWVHLGACRCDDASTVTLQGADGKAYNPNYKIVFDKSILLAVGDELRALNEDGTTRGEGTVKTKTHCNYLNYQAVLL